MYDVVALGEVIIDFTPDIEPAVTTHTRITYKMNPGGAPANVLAAVSRLGGGAAFIGMTGDDGFGHFLKEQLELIHINTSGLKCTKEANTALAFVHIDAKGDRSFSFYRNPGADTKLRGTDIPDGLLNNTGIFHFGSISLTNEPSRGTTLDAVRYAKKAGALISFDPNWRPALWPDKILAKKLLLEALVYTDILKLSEKELELITGETDPEYGSRILFDSGMKLVVVTLGPKGCYYRYAKGTAGRLTYDTDVIDTTGAGDAFTGALLYRLSQSGEPVSEISLETMADIIDFSNAAGAVCAAGRGAIPAMPEMKDVDFCRKNVGFLY